MNRIIAIALVVLIGGLAHVWLELRDARERLAQTQHWALYCGSLAMKANNEVIRMKKRIDELEKRAKPMLPPVGDWEGVMR